MSGRTTNFERPTTNDLIIPTMPAISPERDQQFRLMRDTAREIFTEALKNASIENAFARNVHCERRVLRIGDDLYDLDSYYRFFVVSIGKAAYTMGAALGSPLRGRPGRR